VQTPRQEDRCSIRELIAQYDWAGTALGASDDWPVSLKSMLAMVLAADMPMLLWWGKDLVQFYNDAFRPSLGVGRHPRSLGQPALECWQDVWPIVGRQIENVIAHGRPTVMENALVPIWRNGRMEEVYWDYTYTPVYGDEGDINGVLIICQETTARVLALRRQALIAAFKPELDHCSTREDVIVQAMLAAHADSADIRYLYLADAEPPSGPRETLTVPTGEGRPELSITFGISDKLPFDEAYRNFLEQFMSAIREGVLRVESARKYEIALDDRDRLLLEAPVGTAVLVGPDLVFQLANQVYRDIVGIEDIIGKSFTEVFPQLVGTDDHQNLLNTYRTGITYTGKERHLRMKVKGSEQLEDKYYSYGLAPLRNLSGSVYGLMSIVIDITPHIVALRDIERLNRNLSAASQAKDEFLAMLAHELRNPLAPICAAAELLAVPQLDEDKIRRASAVVQRQVRHMAGLVDDLLDVSRVTKGLIELDMQLLDARRVVLDAVEQAGPAIEARQHHLAVHTLSRPALVSGDHKRLVQVLANILVNAAKYTPQRGEVVVEMALAGDQVRIGVTDNGIGMDEELVARAFELFAQAKRTPDRSQGGLGIGLALVKTLVELHGGSVAASSEGMGKGSRFTVNLPLLEGN
jgi:signal transduction histidine kinase